MRNHNCRNSSKFYTYVLLSWVATLFGESIGAIDWNTGTDHFYNRLLYLKNEYF